MRVVVVVVGGGGWLPFNHVSVVVTTSLWHTLTMMAVSVAQITFPHTCTCHKSKLRWIPRASCHVDTWAFARTPAKSSKCRWVTIFCVSLYQTHCKLSSPQSVQSTVQHLHWRMAASYLSFVFSCFYRFSQHPSLWFMLLPGPGFMEHIKLMKFTSDVTMAMTLDWMFLTSLAEEYR